MQEYRCNCMRGNIALFPLPQLSFFSLFSAFLIFTHLCMYYTPTKCTRSPMSGYLFTFFVCIFSKITRVNLLPVNLVLTRKTVN